MKTPHPNVLQFVCSSPNTTRWLKQKAVDASRGYIIDYTSRCKANRIRLVQPSDIAIGGEIANLTHSWRTLQGASTICTELISCMENLMGCVAISVGYQIPKETISVDILTRCHSTAS